MKTLFLTLAAALVFVSPVLAGPAMTVDQAANIAQQHLKERGLQNEHFVTSLVLEKDSITRGDHFWYARWSESVKLEEQKTEIGLRINMDGSIVRVVEGPASQPKSHRTRSDRPSILDLKH